MNYLKETRTLYHGLPAKEQVRIIGRLLSGAFPQILSTLPSNLGRTLDFGCGHGLYLNLLMRAGKITEGVGIDIDPKKIALAQNYAVKGVEFAVQSLEKVRGPFDTIITADVLYLLPLREWPAILTRFRALLHPGGRLIVKTVLKKNNWKHLWGCLQEQVAVHVLRITAQEGSEFTYLTRTEWQEILERHGFSVDSFQEIGGTPHNHALFISVPSPASLMR